MSMCEKNAKTKTSKEIANELDDLEEAFMDKYGDTPIDKIPEEANKKLDDALKTMWVRLEDHNRELEELKQKLREFWKWLQRTSWCGVSPELVDEFGERFEGLLKK